MPGTGEGSMLRHSRLFQDFWTFLSLASAFLIWALTIAAAAWNGANFAVWSYLITSTLGTIGLLAGFFALSRRKIFNWITLISAIAIATLSVIYAAEFIINRAPRVPLNDPLIAIYAGALLCCSMRALLAVLRLREQNNQRVNSPAVQT
jgi:hypothetical protein